MWPLLFRPPREFRVSLAVFCATMAPRYSRGVAKEGGQFLPRRRPAKTLAGTVVEKRGDALNSRPADPREGRLLGMEPADQAVRVLVRAPLPRVVGMGEEHVQDGVLGDLFVLGELLAIVERDA